MRLLDTHQTARLLDIKPKTLEVWRWRGFGPAFRKIGHLVRYEEAEVLAWVDAQARGNTTAHAPAPPRQRAGTPNVAHSTTPLMFDESSLAEQQPGGRHER
jgi:hypothetical protein